MRADRSTRRPGLTLGLLALSHAVVHFQSALMPLIYPILVVEFALKPSEIGLFIAITTATGGLMQLSYGWLTRHIARPTILAVGQVIFGTSLLIAGLSRNMGQLLAAVSASRIGSSSQHPVGNALLSDLYPRERRGFAISAHISGGNAGTVLVPFIGLAVLHRIGWQATIAVFAAPALVVGALIGLTVREDHAEYQRAALASGSLREHFRAVVARGDLRAILAASLVAAGGRGLDIVAPFMLLYLSGPLGFSEGTTALLYALLLVGAIVGPLLAGFLSDRYGRRRILIGYYALCAVGILAFLGAGSNLVLLVPLMLPFGTAVFSESPVLQAFLADRAVGPLRDVAFSVYFTTAFGVGAAWAFVIGLIVQHAGYPVAFGVMAASYLGAAFLVSLVRGEPPVSPEAEVPADLA
ncbi:MAG: MFS transporter [Chloroflexota bacterium]|nr:MFS transporter [Chloroflexota bacterium]